MKKQLLILLIMAVTITALGRIGTVKPYKYTRSDCNFINLPSYLENPYFDASAFILMFPYDEIPAGAYTNHVYISSSDGSPTGDGSYGNPYESLDDVSKPLVSNTAYWFKRGDTIVMETGSWQIGLNREWIKFGAYGPGTEKTTWMSGVPRIYQDFMEISLGSDRITFDSIIFNGYRTDYLPDVDDSQYLMRSAVYVKGMAHADTTYGKIGAEWSANNWMERIDFTNCEFRHMLYAAFTIEKGGPSYKKGVDSLNVINCLAEDLMQEGFWGSAGRILFRNTHCDNNNLYWHTRGHTHEESGGDDFQYSVGFKAEEPGYVGWMVLDGCSSDRSYTGNKQNLIYTDGSSLNITERECSANLYLNDCIFYPPKDTVDDGGGNAFYISGADTIFAYNVQFRGYAEKYPGAQAQNATFVHLGSSYWYYCVFDEVYYHYVHSSGTPFMKIYNCGYYDPLLGKAVIHKRQSGDDSPVEIYNTVIAASPSATIIGGGITITPSDSSNNWIIQSNDIAGIIDVVDYANRDYTPNFSSPMVDAGMSYSNPTFHSSHDIITNTDAGGTIVPNGQRDIGAYEFPVPQLPPDVDTWENYLPDVSLWSDDLNENLWYFDKSTTPTVIRIDPSQTDPNRDYDSFADIGVTTFNSSYNNYIIVWLCGTTDYMPDISVGYGVQNIFFGSYGTGPKPIIRSTHTTPSNYKAGITLPGSSGTIWFDNLEFSGDYGPPFIDFAANNDNNFYRFPNGWQWVFRPDASGDWLDKLALSRLTIMRVGEFITGDDDGTHTLDTLVIYRCETDTIMHEGINASMANLRVYDNYQIGRANFEWFYDTIGHNESFAGGDGIQISGGPIWWPNGGNKERGPFKAVIKRNNIWRHETGNKMTIFLTHSHYSQSDFNIIGSTLIITDNDITPPKDTVYTTYQGDALTTTNPGASSEGDFWITAQNGTYTNFGNQSSDQGHYFRYESGQWVWYDKDLVTFDQVGGSNAFAWLRIDSVYMMRNKIHPGPDADYVNQYPGSVGSNNYALSYTRFESNVWEGLKGLSVGEPGQGYYGVNPSTIHRKVEMFNDSWINIKTSKPATGASSDLHFLLSWSNNNNLGSVTKTIKNTLFLMNDPNLFLWNGNVSFPDTTSCRIMNGSSSSWNSYWGITDWVGGNYTPVVDGRLHNTGTAIDDLNEYGGGLSNSTDYLSSTRVKGVAVDIGAVEQQIPGGGDPGGGDDDWTDWVSTGLSDYLDENLYTTSRWINPNVIKIDPSGTDPDADLQSARELSIGTGHITISSNTVILWKYGTTDTISDGTYGYGWSGSNQAYVTFLLDGVENVYFGAYGDPNDGRPKLWSKYEESSVAQGIWLFLIQGGSDNLWWDNLSFTSNGEAYYAAIDGHYNYHYGANQVFRVRQTAGNNIDKIMWTNCDFTDIGDVMYSENFCYNCSYNSELDTLVLENVLFSGVQREGVWGHCMNYRIYDSNVGDVNVQWHYKGDGQGGGDAIQLGSGKAAIHCPDNGTHAVINSIVDRSFTGNKFCIINPNGAGDSPTGKLILWGNTFRPGKDTCCVNQEQANMFYVEHVDTLYALYNYFDGSRQEGSGNYDAGVFGRLSGKVYMWMQGNVYDSCRDNLYATYTTNTELRAYNETWVDTRGNAGALYRLYGAGAKTADIRNVIVASSNHNNLPWADAPSGSMSVTEQTSTYYYGSRSNWENYFGWEDLDAKDLRPSSSASILYNSGSTIPTLQLSSQLINNRDHAGVSFPQDGVPDQGAYEYLSQAAPPEAPVLKATTDITQNSAQANWYISSGATTYYMDVSTSDDPTFSSPLAGYDNVNIGNFTFKEISGLTIETSYIFRLRAYNPYGFSGYSATGSFTTLPSPPNVPTNLITVNIGETTAQLGFDFVSGATDYEIRLADNASYLNPIFDGASTSGNNFFNAYGLSEGTIYYWSVRSVGPGGRSAYSGSISFTTDETVECPSKVIINPVTGITTESGTLNWQLPAQQSQGFLITVSLDDPQTQLLWNDSLVSPLQTSITVPDLFPETDYYWSIVAFVPACTSAVSAIGSWTTLTPIPDAPITNTFTNITNNSMRFNWFVSQYANTYTWQISENISFASPIFEGNTADLYADIPGLQSNRTYYGRVKAINGSGESAWSTILSGTTLNSIPDPPTAMTATAINQTSFIARWAWPVTGNVTNFKIWVDDDFDFSSPDPNYNGITTGLYTQFQVSNLVSGGTYYYRLVSVNEIGDSGYSGTVEVKLDEELGTILMYGGTLIKKIDEGQSKLLHK